MAPCSIVANINREEEQLEVVTPTRNVVFAVNYEVSMVDQFLAQSKQQRRRRTAVEPVLISTTSENNSATNYNENEAPNPVTEDEGTTTTTTTTTTATTTQQTPAAAAAASTAASTEPRATGDETSSSSAPATVLGSPTPTSRLGTTPSRRKSARERPRKGQPLARARVRYDMQMVPPATRNRAFLQQFEAWWKKPPSPSPPPPQPAAAPPRRSTRLSSNTTTEAATSTTTPKATTTSTTTTTTTTTTTAPCAACHSTPFLDDSQVIWVPAKRSEWEDSVSELTAVCTSAAIRRLRAQAAASARGGTTTSTNKPFHAPLSRDYIRDRVDIDDPLYGYQLRHKHGGWLQGFVLWTNFTTWTHYFKWDSQHAVSGMAGAAVTPLVKTLTAELEAQPRSGDPLQGGVVFPTIAEIGLLGGLGAGEYMLRMALESIRRHEAGYRYVVLQATDSSKTFYERFGFVRVGAICRYGKSTAATAGGVVGSGEPAKEEETPVQGYRHWTHANESERSLQKHGGPSYMMCLKLPTDPAPPPSEECCHACGQPTRRSFLEQMMDLAVEQKPTIEQLGAATPISKTISRRNSTASLPDMLPSAAASLAAPATVPPKRGRGRPPKWATTPRRKNMPSGKQQQQQQQQQLEQVVQQRQPPSTSSRPALKHSLSLDSREQPPTKRRRVESRTRTTLLSPPPEGKSLTYAQKQYHSVWLAVPPATEQKPKPSPRPPPKRRPSLDPSAAGAIATRSAGPVKPTPKKARSSASSSSSKNPVRSPRPNLPPPAPLVLGGRRKAPAAIDKAALYKQKVKAYPRSRIHYFNRVVKAKNSQGGGVLAEETNHRYGKQQQPYYYFVLQYDEPTGLIKIVPMTPKGKLTGKREGRPRYQAVVGDTDSNFVIAKSADYVVVPATMVMKTPVVACEAWDIEDEA